MTSKELVRFSMAYKEFSQIKDHCKKKDYEQLDTMFSLQVIVFSMHEGISILSNSLLESQVWL
jgi:hypothetical protein